MFYYWKSLLMRHISLHTPPGRILYKRVIKVEPFKCENHSFMVELNLKYIEFFHNSVNMGLVIVA